MDHSLVLIICITYKLIKKILAFWVLKRLTNWAIYYTMYYNFIRFRAHIVITSNTLVGTEQITIHVMQVNKEKMGLPRARSEGEREESEERDV